MIFALKDKFGDHGNTALISVSPQFNKEIWKINIFLMSCRIIGRMAENLILSQIIKILKKRKENLLIGEYKKSKKNALVKNLYKSFNFKNLGKNKWSFAINKQKINNDVIELINAKK